MQITDLPEELLIMIIRELDLQSLESMYNTCKHIRNIVCMHGVIRKCNMSMNVMATANTLGKTFFKDISWHLQELNLCGVPDLFKTSLLTAMKLLKRLKILDVSYTNITIIDLLDMHQICPTLKDISINFVFGKPGLVKIEPKTVLQCQLLFEHFENVHFVGSHINLIYSKLANHLLEKAKLNNLKFTAAECDYVCTTNDYVQCSKLPQFNYFAVYLLNWKEPNTYHGCTKTMPLLTMIEMKKNEFIVIIIMSTLNGHVIYASPVFQNFFKDNFNVDAKYYTDFQSPLLGNVVFMVWNKETTIIDEDFFFKLRNRIKIYFPLFCSSPYKTQVPKKFDWFHIRPTAPDVEKEEDAHTYEPEVRKRRIVPPNFVLNYDTMFKEKNKFQLSLKFIAHITSGITLTTNCDYLRKLTFLSLSGSVRYSSEFFNVLFRCCDNLITLNVHAPPISPCASSISRSIPLSHSLKNFRLVDKRIDFKTLFSSFSQCPILENIHILDEAELELCDIADPSIILEKCYNLYSLYIEARMSDTARIKKLQMLNKAKVRCNKHYINIVLLGKTVINKYRYNYDPYVGVFNLSPIKPF